MSSYNAKSKQQEHSIMMVEHTSAGDIYLCDNCDAEFIGLEKMKVNTLNMMYVYMS